MAIHNNTGTWGENIACDILVKEGCAIAERNCRSKSYEIDIIAMRGDAIVFAEVKTRSENGTDPFDALTPSKLRHMVRAADNYVKTHNIPHRIEFDFFAITGNEHHDQVEHIKDMTMPLMRTRR